MTNKKVIAIFGAGIVLLLVAFWAGLNVSRDRQENTMRAGQTGKTNASNTGQQASQSGSSKSDVRYIVRVATFGTGQEANQLTQELRTKYLSAYTQDPEPGGKDTLYHVNIGPYDSRDAADQVAQELAAEGRKGVMILEQGH